MRHFEMTTLDFHLDILGVFKGQTSTAYIQVYVALEHLSQMKAQKPEILSRVA